MSDLVNALQQSVQAKMDLINANFSAKLSVANMNRILYINHYSKLDAELDQINHGEKK